MALSKAWGHDGVAFTGKDMRQLIEGIWHDYDPGGGTIVNAGPLGETDFQVTQQASPGPTLQVAAGFMVIDATGAGLFGKYHIANDASLNSPSFTATGANGRKDRLIVRVTAGIPALEIVQGVASGSPVEPAITGDNFYEIAMITLPPSTTNITTAMITGRRVIVANATSQPLWTAYTPTWLATGGSPILGNGTLTGRYTKTGRRCTFQVYLAFGSTTNGSTGNYTFALPFQASALDQAVLAKCFSNGPFNWSGFGYINPSASTVSPYFPVSASNCSMVALNQNVSGAPLILGVFTLTTGSNILIDGTYETAT